MKTSGFPEPVRRPPARTLRAVLAGGVALLALLLALLLAPADSPPAPLPSPPSREAPLAPVAPVADAAPAPAPASAASSPGRPAQGLLCAREDGGDADPAAQVAPQDLDTAFAEAARRAATQLQGAKGELGQAFGQFLGAWDRRQMAVRQFQQGVPGCAANARCQDEADRVGESAYVLALSPLVKRAVEGRDARVYGLAYAACFGVPKARRAGSGCDSLSAEGWQFRDPGSLEAQVARLYEAHMADQAGALEEGYFQMSQRPALPIPRSPFGWLAEVPEFAALDDSVQGVIYTKLMMDMPRPRLETLLLSHCTKSAMEAPARQQVCQTLARTVIASPQDLRVSLAAVEIVKRLGTLDEQTRAVARELSAVERRMARAFGARDRMPCATFQRFAGTQRQAWQRGELAAYRELP
ncbi:hypothetical protein QRD43_07630 [Pelomonas sp. APW6]|uniref:HEAT repeat domain-containing protein n=1 Tax=Roseateles subflavus TaxID=3053353 RepID=A0ABT7LFZ8_9BURK|nr:hypothetical protein [Pelomonas sp. APW6]MDL5031776.1 hypothetical protein [Pelomonas sp. APW6]